MIRKIIYYLPSITFLIFIICMIYLLGIKSIEITAVFVVVLFIVAGFLLSKKHIIGGVIGILPSVYFIISGQNSKTGLETPIGIFLSIYFLICMYIVYKEKIHR